MSQAPNFKMPALFLGHGSPMYAIEPNRYTEAWGKLGQELKKPKAILVISAHWLTRGVHVTAMTKPQTIHDFGGFPQALFEQQYPAPGSPELAHRIQALLAPVASVTLDEGEWGLDHGAWSLLKYLYPEANIPVVQMSLDATLSDQGHYELAKYLAPLREEGILILTSGNVVHNLRTIDWRADAPALPWANEFNQYFLEQLNTRNDANLIDWRHADHGALMSIPSPDHYWPVLYTLGITDKNEKTQIITDGIELGSISMLGFSIGNQEQGIHV
jgi:4,5-DOPA dioxygenase extradiol